MSTSTGTTRFAAALDAAIHRYAIANPRSQDHHRRACRWLPGGNTRTSLHFTPFPLTFAHGDAQRLTDVDGHVYIDLLGDYSAGLYGHSHPRIVAAVSEAVATGVALGGPNVYEAELAELLTTRFPSVELVRFTNSGTEANLLAVTSARAITGRTTVLVFDGGYHGSVLSFRGVSRVNVPFPVVVAEFNDIAGTVGTIERHAEELAAVLVEPMLGGAGAIPGSEDFLEAIGEATARHGILLVFDEVMTSRLGPSGYQGLCGIRPDLTTFGKYLGGGFSFGAFGGRADLMSRFDPTRDGALSHPGTFNNNVVSMAAGATGLRDVYTPAVAVEHNKRGDELRARLNRMFVERGAAMIATGSGSILGIHPQATPIAAPRDVDGAEDRRALLHLELIARGYYIARRGYVALPLPLEQGDLDGFVDALDDVLDAHRDVFVQDAR